MIDETRTTWQQGCEDALWECFHSPHYGTAGLYELYGHTSEFLNRAGIARLGRYCYEKLKENHETPHELRRDLVEFYASKQHDYGPMNILRFGPYGIAVRVWDKIARIDNLLTRDVSPANEPLTDSYKDILGYCIIAIMLIDQTFTLPLEPR